MKVLFDTPAVRNDLQNRRHIHRRVGADVRRPVSAGVPQQDHADRATSDMTGRQEGLVTTFGHHTTTRVADRFPTPSIRRAFD